MRGAWRNLAVGRRATTSLLWTVIPLAQQPLRSPLFAEVPTPVSGPAILTRSGSRKAEPEGLSSLLLAR